MTDVGGGGSADVEFRILGPLETVIGGEVVDLGTAKQRSLLALLVMHVNQVVSTERLVEDIWGDQPPARAANAVQVYVSYLRKVLEPDRTKGGESHVLVTRRPGYLLRAEPDQVDALRFERLVDEGRRALAAGNPEAAARRLRQGLDLWRGPALADVAYEPFADREASRLEELRVAAIEDRVEADLARGLHSDLVAELDSLVAAHPLRERLWGQRMVALYRCGRQAEALRAYRDLREALAEELGIDPSPALQRLEEAILQQREELAWTHAGGELGPTAAATPELPGGVVSFLLTDIVSSTSLWEQYPDDMAQALARHDELVAELVDAGGGWLIKSKGEGDATLSVFVRASDAVATALRLQRAVAAEPWSGDLDLAVRIGVHTGEAQLRDGDYFGPTLNRAARIRALAGAGHVLLSQATAELVAERLPDGASLRALGQHTLRGLARPEHVFALAHADLDTSDLPFGDQVAVPARGADEAPRRHNLTLPLTAFVGRAEARAELSALLAHDRLVTLTGPGGAGKTRLAEQVALDNLSRWPDGVWAVELAGLSDPRMVPSAVAAVVGVAEQSGRTITDGLIDALRGRRMLLLLDNCEHVLDAAAELVEQLLLGCPQVDVLATSRQPLSAANEVTWGVPSLAVPPPLPAGDDVEKLLGWESVQLFVDRARLSDPRFDPSEQELRAVGDICRRLDGIPLAIELAAARTGTLAPTEIVARLDNAFELLTTGNRAALPRQQTLRALVDWSHDLLPAEEQALFRRLAVFAGPMRFDGVQAVADDDNARDLLGNLVDRSLVVQESDGVRFRLLETIRQYAYDKLRTAGEEAVYRSRHRDWALALVEQAQPALDAGGDTGWHDRLEEELDNLRTALDWSLGERDGREAAARLAAAANGFWVARHWSEGRQWLERSLAASGPLAPAFEAAARNSAANLAGLQGDFDAARRLLEGSIALGRQLGDDSLVREALHVLGNVTWDHGDFAGAVASYAEALAIARRLDDKRSVARALTNMGALDAWQGEYATATAQCEEALQIARQLGEGLIVRGALINLAYVLLHQGDRARPRVLLTEVLELARREGHTYDVMIAEGALGDVAIADSDPVGARARLTEAVRLARQLGDKSALPELLNSLGRVLLDERDYAAAAEAQHEALELATDTDQQLFRAQAVEGLAAVAVALGDAAAGAHMLGAAEAVRAEIGCPFPPFACHVDRDQLVAAGQAALGAEQWEAARLLGQTLTLDAVLDDAERPVAGRQPRRAAHIGEVFVGRVDELDLLRSAWAGALAGQRQVVLLAGEPGIGKTRLAAEFASIAADDGAVVLQGRCEEEMLVPYQPFVEVLREYVVDAPITQLQEHAARAGELARLVPELGERLIDLPTPRPADAETERFRLFEAVAGLLESASMSAPLLVVLDDLQWADRSALLLLKYLARGRGPTRLLLLGTYRDTELDRQHPLWETVADLRREPHFARLALGGLDRDSVAELLRAVGHGGDDRTRAGLAGILRQETAGNPFFVGEIVRHLLESGADVDDAGVAVPEGVRDVIGRRLARLSPAAVAALTVAAVIGDSFEVPVLEQACELSDDSVLAALDEAAAAHLLEEQPDLDTYAFCHSLVRSAILEELSASRRARLHRRVGLVLEGIYTGDVDTHLSNLASRFAKSPVATDWPKALDYARRAADRALSQLAYETAADQYARAIELLERQESADDLRIELLLAMGDAHNRAGQDEAAKRTFMEAADLARSTGRTVALAKAAIGFCGQLRIGFDVEDPRAVALLEEALTSLGDEDSAERAIALSRLALARYRSGAHAERRWQVDEALDVARRMDAATLAQVLVSRHWTLYGPDDLDERVAAATELAELGATLGDSELVLHARQAQVHDFFELGQVDDVQAAIAERDRLADELRHPYYLWSVLVTRAMDAAIAGRFAEAEGLAAEALQYRVEHDVQQAFTVHSAQFLQVLWLQGRLGELDPGWVRRAGWDPESHRALYLLTWMAAGAGRLDDAALHLEALLAKGLDQLPRNIEWFVAMAALADASDVLRHDKAATQLYDLLLPYEARNCAVGQSAFYGAVAHWLGVIAGVLDRQDDAIRHLRDGLARHESMQAPPFVALSQAALARALRRRGADGDIEEADTLEASARTTAEDLGMRGLLASLSG